MTSHEAAVKTPEQWNATPSGEKMLYRRFGRTGLSMPVFSTGGMRYQHGWKDVPLDEIPEEGQQNLAATIHRSIEVGINHIETARGYGPSERQLGLVLPELPRDQIIVQTKVGPTEDPAEFRTQFEDSLERLRLDHVDLLSFHGINNRELLDQTIRALPTARRLVDEGLARHIGFSTHGLPDEVLAAVECDDHGGFDYFNVHWYYIYQRNWPAIEAATRRDMGVFLISPTDKGGRLYDPPERLCELCAPLHPIEFNDLFCLNQPNVHTLSLGAARPSDYDLHMAALRRYEQREQLLPPILERLERAVHDRFGRAFAEGWMQGVPDWRKSPGDVNVQIIVWLVMLAESYDLEEYGKMRYGLLGQGGHWFAGANLADADLKKLEEALAQAPHRSMIMEVLSRAHGLLFRQPEKRLSES